MINSLYKDSHMPLDASLSKRLHLDKSIGKRATKNNQTQLYTNISYNKPAELSFSGFPNASKKGNVLSRFIKKTVHKIIKKHPNLDPLDGETFKKFYKMADKNEPVFYAFFALGLTCILRPASIMSLPGDKNKEDKMYASAHSIASGLISYVSSVILLSPLGKACEKLKDNPEKFFGKDSKFLKNKDALSKGTTYAKMLPEAAIAVPRALLTVALIPPILKYVFGWEKKKKIKNNPESVLTNYAAINFKSAKQDKKTVFQAFMGGEK